MSQFNRAWREDRCFVPSSISSLSAKAEIPRHNLKVEPPTPRLYSNLLSESLPRPASKYIFGKTSNYHSPQFQATS